jgi:hypothetical protein
MLSGPDAFHTIAGELLQAALAELTPPPARACVVPGAIAWDDCSCEGGQLAVSVGRHYRTASFPTETTTGGPCAAAFLAAPLLVQIIRCAPTPAEGELAPSCEALAASAAQVTADAWRVRRGVHCHLSGLLEAEQIEDYAVGGQPILGPAGACVGSELTVVVAIPDVCCPPEGG